MCPMSMLESWHISPGPLAKQLAWDLHGEKRRRQQQSRNVTLATVRKCNKCSAVSSSNRFPRLFILISISIFDFGLYSPHVHGIHENHLVPANRLLLFLLLTRCPWLSGRCVWQYNYLMRYAILNIFMCLTANGQRINRMCVHGVVPFRCQQFILCRQKTTHNFSMHFRCIHSSHTHHRPSHAIHHTAATAIDGVVGSS